LGPQLWTLGSLKFELCDERVLMAEGRKPVGRLEEIVS
jgi:hypothetical protein